ncbi:MAG TPA: lytic murein transglycosylase [Hellea balneolensis]|uniref:Lytic murein transglycosylase n=1 Tax=Hellea balneolensis TaxID=287478 RepID=A0A7C5LVU7_9PROT|nr:lytic murein transglycosylase [Hellea balneolensis]
MMKYALCLGFALSACASSPNLKAAIPTPHKKPLTTVSKEVQDFEQKFTSWKKTFIVEALQKGYDKKLVARTIGKAKINPKAITKDRKQPEYSRPLWDYLAKAASTERINTGKTKLAANAALFSSVEARYNVDKYILAAIWGLESDYGTILGDDDMIDALSTLAADGRRKAFAENQLYAILELLASGHVRQSQLRGSWAGAMGMTQFIPTTFRDYAVDYDNNGNIDLWTNKGDALGSAANYLSRFGWRNTEPVLAEVKLPKGFDMALADGVTRSISGWAGLGVVPMNGQNWSNQALFLEAKLLVPAGAKGPIFLSFKNFDVIKKYNNSTAYALGIAALAHGFQDKTMIIADWPTNDVPLTRSQRIKLQQALTKQGFDTGGVDGILGPKSRRAIRAWQKANHLPVDGYVNIDLYGRIIKG